MHNKSDIVEKFFKLPQDRRAVQAVFPALGKDDYKRFPYAFGLYVNDSPPLPVIAYMTADRAAVNLKFKQLWADFLRRHKRPGFKDVLFFLDSYPKFKGMRDNCYDLKFKPQPIVDAILAESYGCILWHHQLENLLRVFVDTPQEALRLRKALNAGLPQAMTSIGGFCFDDGTALAAVLKEREVLGVTAYPNTRGAANLFHWLKKQ